MSIIKTLYISHYSGIGGANISMVYMIKNLRDEFYIEPYVIIPMHGPIEKILKKENIEYRVIRYASWRTADRGFFMNIAYAIMMLCINIIACIRLTKQFNGKIDIIHSNSSLVGLGVILKLFWHRPLVWHLREFGTKDYPLIFLLGERISGRIFGYSDKLVAISKAINNHYKRLIGKNKSLQIVYNGVDDTIFKAKTKEKRQKENIVKCCIVGGLNDSKNQKEVICAASKIKDRVSNFKIDIIGDGDWKYIIELQQMIDNLGLNQYIEILGKSDNVYQILSDYDIGIAASKEEAFGRVVIEYMLSGLATIVSNAGAFTELVDNDKNGIIYELGNVKDLSKKISDLILDENKRIYIAKAGRKHALNNFTANRNAENIHNIYQELMEQ